MVVYSYLSKGKELAMEQNKYELEGRKLLGKEKSICDGDCFFLEDLISTRESIKSEFGDLLSHVSFSSTKEHYDDDQTVIRINYYYYENDEQFNARKELEARKEKRVEEMKAAQNVKDSKKYEELKKKYETLSASEVKDAVEFMEYINLKKHHEEKT